MTHLIDKDAAIAEIYKWKNHILDCGFPGQGEYEDGNKQGELDACDKIVSIINALEVKAGRVYNGGWIDCHERMPEETEEESDTLQGHREWTESKLVLAYDSMYGALIDHTINGKWMSEQKRGGYTGQISHGIIAWRPIPEFSEDLLMNARIKSMRGE